jgi:hypothetical protein
MTVIALLGLAGCVSVAAAAEPADWMQEAHWGVMTHYLGAPPSSKGGAELTAEAWNEQVDRFDVPGLVEQVASTGAKYLLFTIGQNSGHYCAPNAAYDRIVGIVPSKCSRRDLVADLAKALARRGVRLMVYLPNGAPGADPVARKKLGWRWGAKGGWQLPGEPVGGRLVEFQRNWEAVIREWSLRWGKLVSGWWIDGCYFADQMYRFDDEPNFASFARALKAGNPDAIVAFNPGVKVPVISMTRHEDYTAGEINLPQLEKAVEQCPGPWIDCEGRRVQFQILTYLGTTWCRGERPQMPDEKIVALTRRLVAKRAAITFDVPIQKSGLIPQPFVDQLRAIGQGVSAGRGSAGKSNSASAFDVHLDVVHQELNPKFCWFHPRVAAVPGAGRNGQPAVIMTLQKHLGVSDHYSGLWMMRTDDLGRTWTGPTEIPELAWGHEPGGVVLAVADVTPGFHPATGKLLAIGCSVRYGAKGQQLSDVRRFSQTAYAVYDPKTGAWSRWQTLDMPNDEKFNMARCACAQWLVQPDGGLLLPIYFAPGPKVPSSVTVVRCRFDGRKLTYVEHGSELALGVVRGLGEPSIAAFRGRYYLTIRNDLRGYVTTSGDGLHYAPIRPWTFDDGAELGSYNTQQHWVVGPNALVLAYTRRGANNDHIMRNRAPIFAAQVDPERLCVLRGTERAIIPERGVMLGNFGAAAVTGGESWVTDAEFIRDGKPSPRGADGTLYAARILWTNAAGRQAAP